MRLVFEARASAPPGPPFRSRNQSTVETQDPFFGRHCRPSVGCSRKDVLLSGSDPGGLQPTPDGGHVHPSSAVHGSGGTRHPPPTTYQRVVADHHDRCAHTAAFAVTQHVRPRPGRFPQPVSDRAEHEHYCDPTARWSGRTSRSATNATPPTTTSRERPQGARINDMSGPSKSALHRPATKR